MHQVLVAAHKLFNLHCNISISSVACGIWFSDRISDLGLLHWECRVVATWSAGNSQIVVIYDSVAINTWWCDCEQMIVHLEAQKRVCPWRVRILREASGISPPVQGQQWDLESIAVEVHSLSASFWALLNCSIAWLIPSYLHSHLLKSFHSQGCLCALENAHPSILELRLQSCSYVITHSTCITFVSLFLSFFVSNSNCLRNWW